MYSIDYWLDCYDLNVKYEKNLPCSLSALIIHNNIYIKPGLSQQSEICTVAEEVMHKKYTSGNIVSKYSTSNEKQEVFARRKAHTFLIPFQLLIKCYDLGLRTYFEVAEFLNVTEKFLCEAVEHFRQKYGIGYYDKKTDCYFSFGSTIQIFKNYK